MLKFINSLLVVLLIISLGAPVGAETRPYSGLVMSEVKVRYDTSTGTDVDEYIELHNDSVSPITLSSYQIHYFNTPFPVDSASPVIHPISTGILAPDGRLVLARQTDQVPNSLSLPFASLSDSGGRLRLVTTAGTIADEIAWTSTQSQGVPTSQPPVLWQCNSSSVACNSNRVMSLTKTFDPILGYNITSPLWQIAAISPQSIALEFPTLEPPEEEMIEPEVTEEVVTILQTCEGVIISEVLPNPSGSDGGKEFIEIHNPTHQPIALLGCAIQTSANSKQYQFGNLELSAGEYLAFYSSETGLTLPNTAGGTVWLVSDEVELFVVTYPGSLEDDMAWAISENGWNKTYITTPNLLNSILAVKPCAEGETRNESTGRCQRIVVASASVLTSCAPGQERNPATNRCRAIANNASFTACGPGQERNPDTNRCRSVASALNALVPCKPSQERNPETNRCRATDQQNALQTCPVGQERNPDTNRCRKVSSKKASTLAAVTDAQTTPTGFGTGWWIAGGVVLLAIGYAIYEWRHELTLLFGGLKTRLKI